MYSELGLGRHLFASWRERPCILNWAYVDMYFRLGLSGHVFWKKAWLIILFRSVHNFWKRASFCRCAWVSVFC